MGRVLHGSAHTTEAMRRAEALAQRIKNGGGAMGAIALALGNGLSVNA